MIHGSECRGWSSHTMKNVKPPAWSHGYWQLCCVIYHLWNLKKILSVEPCTKYLKPSFIDLCACCPAAGRPLNKPALDVWIPSPEDTCILYQYKRKSFWIMHSWLFAETNVASRHRFGSVWENSFLFLLALIVPTSQKGEGVTQPHNKFNWLGNRKSLNWFILMFFTFTLLTHGQRFEWPLTSHTDLFGLSSLSLLFISITFVKLG